TAHGGTWTKEDGRHLIGTGLYQAAPFFQSKGVKLPAKDIVDTLSDAVFDHLRRNTPWRAGVLELLDSLNTARIPSVIVTMSQRPAAIHIAEKLGIRHVISGSDIINAQRSPEAYLLGAALAGADAENCVAIDASLTGLASAAASGAPTL